ncbi:MAG TPA: glycine oxidase ThiO [Byssovorax sp.]|jgi:glycine oxidase
MTAGADALIVGGGVIGLSIALRLAGDGARVTILDAGAARPPASLAAAGILGAQVESHGDGPLTRLCVASRERFPAFVARVEAASGLDVELRACGALVPAFDASGEASLDRAARWQRAAGLQVEELTAGEARDMEPSLSPNVTRALRFPRDGRVDPRALVGALARACELAGVVTRPGVAARLSRTSSRADDAVSGVVLDDGGHVESSLVVLCAGSWSSLVGASGLEAAAVEPVRGQMLELAAPGLVRGVVVASDVYLSPRDDGRVLVGSTVERAGYDARVTASAARDLLSAALRVAPALERAAFTSAWAGLRPRARRDLPLLGRGASPGLLFATGHFRNGVLLSAITADVVLALATGAPSPVDLAPFDPTRSE